MLFQKTIIKKYLTLIDNERVSLAWKQFQADIKPYYFFGLFPFILGRYLSNSSLFFNKI